MQLPARHLILTILMLLQAAAHAGEQRLLPGQVVRVIDGDTIVIDAGSGRHRIRLAGIDALERNQPWGDTRTRELRRQIAGQEVVVEWSKKDRSERLIGIVRLDGEDINLHQVERGLAWHFKRYAGEQNPEDKQAYSAAEQAAQSARRGLWSDPEPVPPWDWRKR